MKRTGFKPRTEQIARSTLKSKGGALTRRARINPRSQKTIDRAPARAACVATVIARDGGCVFWRYVSATAQCLLDPAELAQAPTCGGPLTAHEPAHRRNTDPTDPANCLCACSVHNAWLEDHPAFGYATGLLVKGNGLGLRR